MWNGGGLYLGLRSMTFEFDEEEEYSGSKPIWTLHCLSFFSVWLWLWLLVWVWLWHRAISCRHLPATDEKKSLRRKWQFCPTQMSKITKLILKKKMKWTFLQTSPWLWADKGWPNARRCQRYEPYCETHSTDLPIMSCRARCRPCYQNS